MKLEILVAEDHAIIRDGLRKILADTDDLIVAGEACNGNMVLEKIREREWHMVMLDLSMPGMTGFDIAQEIHENPDLRPEHLVAVTGHGMESDRQRTKASGFDHHLLKPVDFQNLEAIVKSVPARNRLPR